MTPKAGKTQREASSPRWARPALWGLNSPSFPHNSTLLILKIGNNISLPSTSSSKCSSKQRRLCWKIDVTPPSQALGSARSQKIQAQISPEKTLARGWSSQGADSQLGKLRHGLAHAMGAWMSQDGSRTGIIIQETTPSPGSQHGAGAQVAQLQLPPPTPGLLSSFPYLLLFEKFR